MKKKKEKKTKEEITYQFYSDMPDEVKLPPHLRRVFDFTVNYANKWDMFRRGMYKPTLVELDQFKAKKLKIKLNDEGYIIDVKKEEELTEEEEEKLYE